MTFARAATGFIAALVAFVALAPFPASANVVLTADLVCANVTFSPFSVVQSNPTTYGTVILEVINNPLPPPNQKVLKATFKGFGLTNSIGQAPECAVICTVDGELSLFESASFAPCEPGPAFPTPNTVLPNGTFTAKPVIPLGDSFTDPFNGGCLLSVPAFLVPTPNPNQVVVCSPGFGRFNSFTP